MAGSKNAISKRESINQQGCKVTLTRLECLECLNCNKSTSLPEPICNENCPYKKIIFIAFQEFRIPVQKTICQLFDDDNISKKDQKYHKCKFLNYLIKADKYTVQISSALELPCIEFFDKLIMLKSQYNVDLHMFNSGF